VVPAGEQLGHNRQEIFAYDLNGNLASLTDRRGKVTTLQYDGLNRNTFAGYGTTVGPAYESTISYSYDGGNRLQRKSAQHANYAERPFTHLRV
jgi:hypothetical protein